MSKRVWHSIQFKEELYKKIRSLAFPEPELEHREVASALLEIALQHPEEVEQKLREMRSAKQ